MNDTGVRSCKKCGADDRNKNGDCRPCANARGAQCYARKAEKFKATAAKRNAENIEKARAMKVENAKKRYAATAAKERATKASENHYREVFSLVRNFSIKDPRTGRLSRPSMDAMKEFRRVLHLTHADLAALVEIEVRLVKRWETGEMEPLPSTKDKLLALLEAELKKAAAEKINEKND